MAAFASPQPPFPPPAPSVSQSPESGPPRTPFVRPGVNRQAQQYRRAQIETASPTRLIVLLYEGAIRFCLRAQEAMEARDLETQNTNLVKAQRIVAELMSSLKRDAGGDMAANLFSLYTYMMQQLVEANLYDRPEPLDIVLKLLRELHETWQTLDLMTVEGAEGKREEGKGKSQGTGNREQGTEGGKQEAESRKQKVSTPNTQHPTPGILRLGERHA